AGAVPRVMSWDRGPPGPLKIMSGPGGPRSNELPHLEHQLALEVAALADAHSFGRVGQAEQPDRRHADGAGAMELGNALERRAGAADRRPQRRHVAAVGLGRLGD